MNIKKVKLRKAKDRVYYTGDLLFYRISNCEITILGYDTILGDYLVIFHDIERIGHLPEKQVAKYCYHIC